MNAKELLDQGNLTKAIQSLIQEVKAHPADGRARTFLFELYCFAGELDRAKTHLEALDSQDPKIDLGIEFYRKVLKAEEARRQVYEGKGTPKFFSGCPDYLQGHLDALNSIREHCPAEGTRLLIAAQEKRPAIQGNCDGQAFTEFADSDDLLAPVLEVIAQDGYFWLPLSQITHLSISPPKHLRDLLWIPAHVETQETAIGVVLPVLYPGSHNDSNDLLKLGRMTDWKHGPDEFNKGVGQHVFIIDDSEKGILEIKELTFTRNEKAALGERSGQ
ncbi:MAG: type VI secretion system accessory protein TagJ [Nitrospirales bacterium]